MFVMLSRLARCSRIAIASELTSTARIRAQLRASGSVTWPEPTPEKDSASMVGGLAV